MRRRDRNKRPQGSIPHSTKPPKLKLYQQQLFTVIDKLGEKAHGMHIVEALEKALGESQSIAAVYITLKRAEQRGLLSSKKTIPDRGADKKAEKLYWLSARGRWALSETQIVPLPRSV